jgi:hypothetical protein
MRIIKGVGPSGGGVVFRRKEVLNRKDMSHTAFIRLHFCDLPRPIVVLSSSTCSQQVSRLFIFTWSHSDTHHSRWDSSGWGIGPSQRPLPDNTNTVQDKHPFPRGIRTHDPSKRSAADLRLRPRGHWDRLLRPVRTENSLAYAHLCT